MTEIQKKRPKPISPTKMVALGFAFIILLTTLLLMLPVSSADGTGTDAVSALFTAVSAVCVTGLIVVDTATHWSLFGKCVLFCAIQTGGLGVMTILGIISVLIGQKIGLRQRTLLQESIATLSLGGIVKVVRRAVIGTALIEGTGAVLFAFRFIPMFGLVKGAAFSIFHSVSAFCNAGFDLMGTVSGPYSSLESFVGDPLINLTAVALILLGGLGFFVWSDLYECRGNWKKLTFHSRIVLLLTLGFVLIPTVLFFFTERNASMAGFDLQKRILASLFSAVTPRTAGFDTVPAGSLSDAGSLLTLVLMLAGGNPGSTAGGAKTTTLFVFFLMAFSLLRRDRDVHILGRSLDSSTQLRACSIIVVYLCLALSASFAVCAMQPELPLRDVLLEVFSAVNTVGMSTGITRSLCTASRLILIALMFSGRLGSLTFALLLTGSQAESKIRYPSDQLLVG